MYYDSNCQKKFQKINIGQQTEVREINQSLKNAKPPKNPFRVQKIWSRKVSPLPNHELGFDEGKRELMGDVSGGGG